VKPYLGTGKVKPLAVTSATRSKQLPGVPAIAETIKSPPVITINGLVAPARVPQAVVDTLSRAIIATEQNPDFVARIDKLGAETMVTTPAEFARIIADDTARWRDTVRELGIKAQ
jgi:tripartite-type tricarboxylate transporter receptor subunit TctC